MTKSLLIVGTFLVLSFLLFNDPEMAQAQTTRRDTIRLMAATRGTNFDGTGLKWCVSQTWHKGVPEITLETALDEVPQTTRGCENSSTEQVELAAYGLTNSMPCTLTAPCPSLQVRITSGRFLVGQCNFIEGRLTDASRGTFKGRQRMLHASGPSGYVLTLHVASDVWYSAEITGGR